MALQSYPRTRLVCSVKYPKINTTVHHYQILSSAVYLNDPPRHYSNNSANMRPSSRPKEPITLATAASAGRHPAQAQSRLPSLEQNTDTDVAIQAFLDSLLVKYLQQEQKKKEQDALVATTIVEAAEENSSVNTFTPTIFITDLIPAPPLPDENTRNSLSKLFQERQKDRLAKFMAKMACHLLYSDHNRPELLKPTQELMEYCAYFIDTVVANAIVMDPTELSILDDLKAEDPELKAYPTLKAALDDAEKSAGTSTPSPAVVMMALKYIHDVVKALKDRNQGA
ncbi:hypothetical protein BGZ97_001477 [Linnemannia gamsii]|jgi:hypothetical protein|uniref:Uncharacterized protein n=1 Tax=Linnemannia gamsii TaxID=64522 RepID=A0A9P6UJ90_9FUNG|nr:hypothetical protein BGZ97_001477 [Linnemannia gamsii]